MMYPKKGPETPTSGPSQAPRATKTSQLARRVGLALGLTAAAMNAGCEKETDPMAVPEPKTPITPVDKELTPAQKPTATPTAAPKAPAPAPAPTPTKLEPVVKSDYFKLSDPLKQYCEDVEGDQLMPLVVDRDSRGRVQDVWLLCDESNTQITKLLDTCDNDYTGSSDSIAKAACSTDGNGYQHIDLVHADLKTKDGRKALVLTASDEQNKQDTEQSNAFHSKKKATERVGELGVDEISDNAEIWLAYPKGGTTLRSAKPTTPVGPVTPYKKEIVRPTVSSKDKEQDRRLTALEHRADGLEVSVQQNRSAISIMQEKLGKKNSQIKMDAAARSRAER